MDQPKQYRILLRPHGNVTDRWNLRNLQHRLNRIIKRIEAAGVIDHPFGNRADFEKKIAELEAKIAAETQNMAPRVIDADLVKIIDNASMIVGIEPGNRTTTTAAITSKTGMHAKALKTRKENPDFYHIAYTAPGVRRPNDPSSSKYIITRKFKKILSINLDNVISINGKPVMGGMRDLDKGVSHLESRDWSIERISDLLDE